MNEQARYAIHICMNTHHIVNVEHIYVCSTLFDSVYIYIYEYTYVRSFVRVPSSHDDPVPRESTEQRIRIAAFNVLFSLMISNRGLTVVILQILR
jgi:hypothetical protein